LDPIHKVVRSGEHEGFLEFIPSIELTDVYRLAPPPSRSLTDRIDNYVTALIEKRTMLSPQTKLEKRSADAEFRRRFQDRYKKTLASHLLVTYLLAVGDRHRGNLKLADDGRLFNVDFGFILGQEPPGKVWQPHVRIRSEELAFAGGQPEVMRTIAEGFRCLRRSSHLLINLIALALTAPSASATNSSSNVATPAAQPCLPVISEEGSATSSFASNASPPLVCRVRETLRDRFLLHKHDEDVAVAEFKKRIEKCVDSSTSCAVDTTREWIYGE
jgi:hypothetical protein